jgi:hypothetical protein
MKMHLNAYFGGRNLVTTQLIPKSFQPTYFRSLKIWVVGFRELSWIEEAYQPIVQSNARWLLWCEHRRHFKSGPELSESVKGLECRGRPQ